MKLTKYTHACVVLEEQGSKVVIDPGVFTENFGDLKNIVAVVVTHAHSDHFSPDHLQAILGQNPSAPIFTTTEVADAFKHANLQIVSNGHIVKIDPFSLHFFGEDHAVIHTSLPVIHNTAVMVNGTFFYPGDSFTKPDMPVKVLAVPANAPWAAIKESMDYLSEVHPEAAFPTHNGLLSDVGQQVYNSTLNSFCQKADIVFKQLAPGESLEF